MRALPHGVSQLGSESVACVELAHPHNLLLCREADIIDVGQGRLLEPHVERVRTTEDAGLEEVEGVPQVGDRVHPRCAEQDLGCKTTIHKM